MLDYGCGTGGLVALVNNARPQLAVGYEPFMATHRSGVYRDFGEIVARASSLPPSISPPAPAASPAAPA
jgi:hypothetical protein